VGSVAIASAAAGDVIAWLILAAILAFLAAPAQHKPLGFTLAMLGAYVVGMLVLQRLWRTEQLAAALVLALISSCLTEWIGVHALFGAFFAGVVIPKTPQFVASVRGMIEPLTTAVFLPVFFAFTGLRTSFGLVLTGDALIYTLLILAVAVTGKWLGAMLAARRMGMGSREANALGILMNTRGLVELVILSIGFDLGLLSPVVFSMMVMMALITTLMTAPLVRRVYRAG
jgi:Kef-type K+ transport system membrane component KefB